MAALLPLAVGSIGAATNAAAVSTPDHGSATSLPAAIADQSPGANEHAVLAGISRVEGLLQLGLFTAAATAATDLPDVGPHASASLRLKCWTMLEARAFPELLSLLSRQDALDSELLFLRGAAKLRAGEAAAGVGELHELWWHEPHGTWGLAALAELATTQAHHTGPYRQRERAAIRRHVPPGTWQSSFSSVADRPRVLDRLSQAVRPSGRLWPEIRHAMGVSLLHAEKFTEAVTELQTALRAAGDPTFRRVIELRLGEAQRRRGSYRTAQHHFARVAANHADKFAEHALALAGRMAIEHRRYPEAQRLYQTQLVQNPVAAMRHEALWGLGWVAFRTGDFQTARGFFDSLCNEAPFGPLAPKAAYWRARALEEMGRAHDARHQMAWLELSFPVDYYAWRARVWRKNEPLPKDPSPPVHRGSQRVAHLTGLAAAGMHQRLARALPSLREEVGNLGPTDLAALEQLASSVHLPELARHFYRTRQHRYPATRDDLDILAAQFPRPYVTMLEREAVTQRIDPDLPAAVAYQESRFNTQAVSPVGALGLMQLMPDTATALYREEHRRGTLDTHGILDPSTNARLGVRYLARMLRAFDRRLEYTLAAYNAGPGAVTRWRESRGDLPADIFVEEIPYEETRAYVARVIAASQILHLLRHGKAQAEEMVVTQLQRRSDGVIHNETRR